MKYFFIKIVLRGVSPMVWRRLRVASNVSLSRLHKCIRIINRWNDFHLHQFHIYGKDYGINYEGGLYYPDNVYKTCLDDFHFEVGDKFTYEYNFFKHIMHDIRIEKIQELPLHEHSIVCLAGSGMPGVTKYDVTRVEYKLIELIIAKKGKLTKKDILHGRKQINRVKFNKNRVNSSLASINKT